MASSSDAQLLSYRQQVLDKCTYFVDVQVWPRNHLSPERWLENFTETEMEYALHLLDAFTFFSRDAVNALLRAAVQSLSRLMRSSRATLAASNIAWQTFLEEVIITHVTGEIPNVTDSGYAFVRKARTILGLNEEQAMLPDEALVVASQTNRPVLFLDDFVGSGNQCIETWTRPVVNGGIGLSFATLTNPRCYYCPLVCTREGLESIAASCPGLTVNPSHVMGAEYSMTDPRSTMWPAHLKNSAYAFLKNASARAGIPDTDGGVDDWRGFHKLGLALAFDDGVPDATLPLFYWEKNGWRPLLRRT